jgi:hypothetical protein
VVAMEFHNTVSSIGQMVEMFPGAVVIVWHIALPFHIVLQLQVVDLRVQDFVNFISLFPVSDLW